MKLLIASDIHGDFASAKHIIEVYKTQACDKILILGDILYHGPRNDLPAGYAPKDVISLLNEYKASILAVRGNCATEVDQMVLESPILADYAILSLDGLTVYATHGHKYNPDNPPPLQPGDILIHGHTHVLASVGFGKGNTYLNPGSIAIPKGGNPPSYMIYEDRKFTTYSKDGGMISVTAF